MLSLAQLSPACSTISQPEDISPNGRKKNLPTVRSNRLRPLSPPPLILTQFIFNIYFTRLVLVLSIDSAPIIAAYQIQYVTMQIEDDLYSKYLNLTQMYR